MSDPQTRSDSQLLLAMDRISAIASDMAEVKSTMSRLADAVTKLAIVEERQATDRQALGRAFVDIEKLSARVGVLEQAQPIQKQSSDFVQKFLAGAAMAAVGAIGGVTVASKTPAIPVVPPAVSASRP